jgi:hypothetical protein
MPTDDASTPEPTLDRAVFAVGAVQDGKDDVERNRRAVAERHERVTRRFGRGRDLDAVIGNRLQVSLRLVEQAQALDSSAPATVLADRDRHDVEARGVERGDHGRGGT